MGAGRTCSYATSQRVRQPTNGESDGGPAQGGRHICRQPSPSSRGVCVCEAAAGLLFRERLVIQWPGACHALHAGVCVVRACDASACARGRVCVAMGTPDPGERSGLTEVGPSHSATPWKARQRPICVGKKVATTFLTRIEAGDFACGSMTNRCRFGALKWVGLRAGRL